MLCDSACVATQVSHQISDFVASSIPLRLVRSRVLVLRQRASTRAAGLHWFGRLLQCRGTDGSQPSSTARAVLIAQLPAALRVERDLPSPSSASAKAREKYDGADDIGPPPHYTDDLKGAGSDCVDETVAAFDELYSTLCGLLVASSNDSLTLCALDAMGMRLAERDHAMLARLDVFGALRRALKRIDATSTGSGMFFAVAACVRCCGALHKLVFCCGCRESSGFIN